MWIRRAAFAILVTVVACFVYWRQSSSAPPRNEERRPPRTAELDSVDEPTNTLGTPRDIAEPPAPVTHPAPSALPAVTQLASANREPSCPSWLPVEGTPCGLDSAAALRCGYGEEGTQIVCDCAASSGKGSTWHCAGEAPAQEPPPCPEAQPNAGSSCTAETQLCRYGVAIDGIMCRCSSGSWSCVDYSQWRHSK
jgi:hypothetical protein